MMSVVIEELSAEVEPSRSHDRGGDGDPQPRGEVRKQSLLDLLELMQERKARLVID
jgi:hypothetical protein